MRFRLAVTTEKNREAAVADLLRQAQEEGRPRTDLGWLFVQREFLEETPAIASALREQLGLRHLAGCTGSGIIGGSREIEHQPAISLLLAELPGVDLVPWRITQEDLEEAEGAHGDEEDHHHRKLRRLGEPVVCDPLYPLDAEEHEGQEGRQGAAELDEELVGSLLGDALQGHLARRLVTLGHGRGGTAGSGDNPSILTCRR